MNAPICYLNGKMVSLADAKIGIQDLGILRAYAVYEGITSINGKPFRFEDHWQRFLRSSEALGLCIPLSRAEFESVLIEVANRNAPGVRATMRVVLTGGEAQGGIEQVPGRETFFVTAEPTVALPEAFYTEGASLITNEHRRSMPEYKTVHYINAVRLQPKRRSAGAIEILYHADGNVLECSTSNFFIVKDGVIITPKDDTLEGITRKVVMELALEAGYHLEERTVSMDEVWAADEALTTPSFKDIVPVVEIDARTVGSGSVGTVTKDVMTRFKEYTGV